MGVVVSESGAKFSRCRRWRYLLWRRWGEGPVANFLMLNPSTADEVKLDPSCTRAREYAKAWGYGSLIVTNLFGWRATDPKNLLLQKDPVGRGNDAAIVEAARSADLVVCAWGNHGLHMERSSHVVSLLGKSRVKTHFLRLNSSGEPAHPLYLPARLRPTPYSREIPRMPPGPAAVGRT